MYFFVIGHCDLDDDGIEVLPSHCDLDDDGIEVLPGHCDFDDDWIEVLPGHCDLDDDGIENINNTKKEPGNFPVHFKTTAANNL